MDKNEFTREKIKVKPVNKEKIIHKSILTMVLAVFFGLVACLTFLLLEPVISNILYPKNIAGQVITLPEEKEELLPGDMVAEKIDEVVTFGPKNEINVSLTDRQLDSIIKGISLDVNDYQNMYQSLSEYMDKMSVYMVEVVGVQSDQDGFFNENEKKNHTAGIIVGKNEESYFILTDYDSISKSDKTEVYFYDGKKSEAKIYNVLEDSNIVILQVFFRKISNYKDGLDYKVVSLGSSYNDKLKGNIVIALGCPLGSYDSVGYGIVMSTNTNYRVTDLNYHLLVTDIMGSSKATGALFDLNGCFVGMIMPGIGDSDLKNNIVAYSVSDLKGIVTHMLKENSIPYFGITGMDVTEEVYAEQGIPKGVYVEEVELNSPAMLSGIQKGDIIIKMDEKDIVDMSGFTGYLLKKSEGETVDVTLKRKSYDGYREMTVKVTIQNLK